MNKIYQSNSDKPSHEVPDNQNINLDHINSEYEDIANSLIWPDDTQFDIPDNPYNTAFDQEVTSNYCIQQQNINPVVNVEHHEEEMSHIPFPSQTSNISEPVPLQSSQNGINNELLHDVQFENDNNNILRNDDMAIRRNCRNIIKLSDEEQYFKDQYYKIFTSRKKFPKKYVQLIHNNVLVGKIKGFKKMERDDFRSINIYFKNHLNDKSKMFDVLEKNINVCREILKQWM
ncbi:hypothetical protein M9Y10_038665 [Tritrichomonas musculus]|uniref:Uncharacterized protein n=1 Tax=Tritrichomonas musculus TaxID=1915356 RepID=A0ABR2K9W3_9EUKA